MAEANARLDFLWKASHLFLGQCPGASSHYMSQFLSLANNRDLRLHEDIQTKSCAACGSIFVPGINSKVRVVPVNETKLAREKSKKADRRKAKLEKRKQSKRDEMDSKNTLSTASTEKNKKDDPLNTNDSNETTPDEKSIVVGKAESASVPPKSSIPESPSQQSTKKIIRVIPYTEQYQQQNQRRPFGSDNNSTKTGKRSSQLLNHIIYSCQRCNRETQIPGTKQEFLTSRIKTSKPISQRRKLKKSRDQVATTSTATPPPTIIDRALDNENSKRHASNTKAQEISNKQAKLNTSIPSSPARINSKSNSVVSSTASSPVSSPRHPGSDSSKLGNNNSSNSKKKKKGGLASLLASQQKPKDSSSDGASGAGGDSVLANFLMGL
ncbi:hypothetical protein BGZ76_007474 [Entomortierella beljakovae]|nr:hypothetical protein BGZ76_007474 [Entomortierella beljakovae]